MLKYLVPYIYHAKQLETQRISWLLSMKMMWVRDCDGLEEELTVGRGQVVESDV